MKQSSRIACVATLVAMPSLGYAQAPASANDPAPVGFSFSAVDTNNDGKVDRAELGKAGYSSSQISGILGGRSSVVAADVVEISANNKSLRALNAALQNASTPEQKFQALADAIAKKPKLASVPQLSGTVITMAIRSGMSVSQIDTAVITGLANAQAPAAGGNQSAAAAPPAFSVPSSPTSNSSTTSTRSRNNSAPSGSGENPQNENQNQTVAVKQTQTETPPSAPQGSANTSDANDQSGAEQGGAEQGGGDQSGGDQGGGDQSGGDQGGAEQGGGDPSGGDQSGGEQGGGEGPDGGFPGGDFPGGDDPDGGFAGGGFPDGEGPDFSEK